MQISHVFWQFRWNSDTCPEFHRGCRIDFVDPYHIWIKIISSQQSHHRLWIIYYYCDLIPRATIDKIMNILALCEYLFNFLHLSVLSRKPFLRKKGKNKRNYTHPAVDWHCSQLKSENSWSLRFLLTIVFLLVALQFLQSKRSMIHQNPFHCLFQQLNWSRALKCHNRRSNFSYRITNGR